MPQPGDYLRLLPTQFTGSFYRVKAAPPIHKNKHREAAKSRRQRNTAQRKEQNKTPEKELNEMEMANLSDAEFKTLVIRMLKKLIEYGNNIKKEMKVTLSEIKKNLQRTNRGGDEAKFQVNDLAYKEKISIQPEQQEDTRIQKNKDSIRSLWDISKHTNIQITGMLEGEEEEQEIKNLFEKIMKENFPNLVKEIYKSRKHRESQTSWTQRGPHQDMS